MDGPFPVTAALTGLAGALASALTPVLVARLPEPEPNGPEEPAGEHDGSLVGTEPAVGGGPEDPKEPYADIAALPGLGWRCSVAGGLVAAAIGLVLGWDPALLVLLPLVPVGLALSVVDWRTRLLPTRLIAPAYAVTLVAVLVAFLLDGADPAALWRTGLGWLVYGGLFFALWFLHPRGLGYGDVRLAGVLGLALGWVGWPELLLGIWAALLLGGLVGGIVSLVLRRRDYPFGPFMLAGAFVGVVLGQPVLAAVRG